MSVRLSHERRFPRSVPAAIGSWEPPRCAGCGCDPIAPLTLVVLPIGYVYLTAPLCSDCHARVDEGERHFLLKQLVEVQPRTILPPERPCHQALEVAEELEGGQ